MGGGKSHKLKKSAKPIRDNFCKKRQEQKLKSQKSSQRQLSTHGSKENNDFDRALMNMKARLSSPRKCKREGFIALAPPIFSSDISVEEDSSKQDAKFTTDQLLEDEIVIPSNCNTSAVQEKARRSKTNHNMFSLLEEDDGEKVLHLHTPAFSNIHETRDHSNDDDDNDSL